MYMIVVYLYYGINNILSYRDPRLSYIRLGNIKKKLILFVMF